MPRSIRVGSAVALSLLGLTLATPRLVAQTADEIVARNIAARGGAAKFQAVQSLKQTAHLKIQGMTATLTIYAKRPNLSRQEMNLAGAIVIAAFDGTNAWGVNPMTGQTSPQMLSGGQADQVRRQADFDPPLLDYKSKGTKLELVGNVPGPAGTTLVHLRMTDRAGTAVQVYLDGQTALETKIVADGPTGPVETALSDYRDVNGIKMPFAIKTTAGGVVAADMTVDTIQFDVPMPPTLFTMPGKL